MATPRVCDALVLAALSMSFWQPAAAYGAEPDLRYISIRLNSPDQPHEDEIRMALAQPTQIEMVDMPLGDVVHFLSDLHKIQILIDHKALEDAGASADTPITFHVEDISLESALELMLEPHNATWIIRNGVLFFTSEDRASELLSTRLYPVRDLASTNAEGRMDFTPLKAMIERTIAPTTWEEVGGSGSISPYIGVLVISQTEQTHRKLENLLVAMRKAKSLGNGDQPEVDKTSTAASGEPVVTPAK